MSYRGIVRNGVVEFDGANHPPDGTVVDVVEHAGDRESGADTGWAQELLKVAGMARNLPADLAAQHDHYLQGTPKR